MGSDSDYLNENGYGFLVEGDIPSNWGSDNSSSKEPDYFETFSEALGWAKNNPGKAITRSHDGSGYIIKK